MSCRSPREDRGSSRSRRAHRPRRGDVSRETDRSAPPPPRTGHPSLPGGRGRPRPGRRPPGDRPGDAHRRDRGGRIRGRAHGHRAAHPLAAARRGRGRPGAGRLAHRAGGPSRERRGQVRTARPAPGAGHAAGSRMAERTAHRFAGRPGDAGDRRARRLLRALSPAARSRGRRTRRGARADRHRGLGLGGDHRGHPAAHPALHDPDRLGHPVPDGPPVAAAVPALRALPGRRRRAADPQGLRAGQGAGRLDPCDHLRLPPGHPAYPADRLPLLVRPGAAGHPVGGPGRRDDRHAAGPRRTRPVHRPGRPDPGPGGVSADPPGRGAVPRGGRGPLGGRGDLHGPGDRTPGPGR